MRVHVVSDVHGDVEGLARAGDGADALVVLGDLVEFVDYHDPSRGILGRVLGAEASARFGELRASGRPGELMRFARAAWAHVPDPPALVTEAVREQYAALFAALPAPTYAIPGNVDLPELWPEFARAGVHAVDGRVVELAGLRFGFVGGVPLPPGVQPHRGGPWRPYVRAAADFDAAVHGLDAPDVLCSHAPPAVPELAYDVRSRRPEAASPALREVIERHRPRAALFGHVHQPLAARRRWGGTECVNVGHFRATGRPYVLRW
ncbi:MAG TPA: metallophosphoesterase [Pseudonocardia sp.]|jgi:Icc-related predicted phosphoesterase|nr:metallophosphoesterase [Pseudonocardia sp.]